MKAKQRIPPIESAQRRFKQNSRNRFLAAFSLALVVLALFILWGPDADQVKKKFEYVGAPGDLKIMDAISIEDGSEKMHQIPKSLQLPPPPARLEIAKETTHEDGIREIPEPQEETSLENTLNPEVVDEAAEEFTRDLVSMATPMQTSKNYYIIYMVRPEYPLEATEAERYAEVIFVDVEWFVSPEGTVAASRVQKTNGSSAFTDEVLAKMDQWIFGFHTDPGPGLWMVTTWNFRSPFSRPTANQRD